MTDLAPVRRALLSVSDKTGLVDLGRALAERGVETSVLSFAIHKLGSFAGSQASLPIAEHVATRGIALPLFPQMRNAEVEQVITTLRGVLRG